MRTTDHEEKEWKRKISRELDLGGKICGIFDAGCLSNSTPKWKIISFWNEKKITWENT